VGQLASFARLVSQTFAVEAWIKTTGSAMGSTYSEGRPVLSADDPMHLFDFGTSILNDHFAFGEVFCIAPACQLPGIATVESTTKVTTGQWVHVAAVRVLSIFESRVFVNGVQEGTVKTSSDGDPLTGSPTIFLGADPVFSRYFSGVIDELRIWTSPRGAAAIQATMHTSLTGSEPALFGYYRFDEGAGSVAHDSSPLGNHMVLGTPGQPATVPTWVVSDAPIY
jgi:hypothetical protein